MSTGGAPVTAVIAAAGSGERLGAGGPKAFVPLAGRPMLEWSIDAFKKAGVAAIVVAAPPGHAYEPAGPRPGARGGAGHQAGGSGSPPGVRVVTGGDTRSASVSNALEAVETELVAVHDAARPMLMPELVSGVLATLTADSGAAGAIAAAPVTDTVKRVEKGASERSAKRSSAAFSARATANAALVVAETLDRDDLWAAQTPQAFRVEALREALAGDSGKGDAATDEAMLVEAAGGRVLIHPVEAENMKVTTVFDLRIAEQLLGERLSS